MASSYDEEIISKNFSPFNFDQLTPHMLHIAKEEWNENETTRSFSLKQLRELITNELSFKCRNDDEFLLQFLRARKFKVEKAFGRFQNFFQVTRKTFANVFANIEDERIKNVLGIGFASFLPYRDRDGAAIAVIKMSNWNVENTDINSIMNCMTVMGLSAAAYPATQIYGFRVLVDVKGTSLQQLWCVNPKLLYLLSKGLQDCMPLRIKGIHFINSSRIFQRIWSITNIFLNKILRNRVHFHDSKMESLQKFFSKEILPAEYGGEYFDFDPIKKDSEEMRKFQFKYLEILRDGYETL